MSKVLCAAARNSLKAAHAAYLLSQKEVFEGHVLAAENALASIQELASEDDFARKMELMALEAELNLIRSLAQVRAPDKLIPNLERAVIQMLLPPSQIVDKSAPMLPSCHSALEFFGGPCEQKARDIERATSLYSHITDGGGGGISEIYRAEMTQHTAPRESARWAEKALEKMAGDRWIEPIALRIIENCRLRR